MKPALRSPHALDTIEMESSMGSKFQLPDSLVTKVESSFRAIVMYVAGY